ncbi:hypothetical protein BGZ70_002547 [Mortierella alpina]|uniref:Uncharacterized protein n=1 Tax=Mortierella alpina TaxID=64518 RepID=A0A9P6IVM2_MORAP|nr:hypothetical protein BGZ70_002547 [Mortierella alpina]
MLFDSDEPTVWEAVLALYPEALAHHVSHKKDNSLLALDQWYQDTLPTLLQSRQPMHIDANELCQLMSWKLKRGKFRPSLAKLAASNADADVKRISQEAFKLLHTKDLRAAITKMAELKGVGPATASGAPKQVPFMADETMDSVPGLGTIAYTIPYYIKFATQVIEKAAGLKARGSAIVNSPHLVEKALWTDYMVAKYGIQRQVQASKDKDEDKGKDTTQSDGKVSNASSSSSSGSHSNHKRKAQDISSTEYVSAATGTSAKRAKPRIPPALSATTTRSLRRRS